MESGFGIRDAWIRGQALGGPPACAQPSLPPTSNRLILPNVVNGVGHPWLPALLVLPGGTWTGGHSCLGICFWFCPRAGKAHFTKRECHPGSMGPLDRSARTRWLSRGQDQSKAGIGVRWDRGKAQDQGKVGIREAGIRGKAGIRGELGSGVSRDWGEAGSHLTPGAWLRSTRASPQAVLLPASARCSPGPRADVLIPHPWPGRQPEPGSRVLGGSRWRRHPWGGAGCQEPRE